MITRACRENIRTKNLVQPLFCARIWTGRYYTILVNQRILLTHHTFGSLKLFSLRMIQQKSKIKTQTKGWIFSYKLTHPPTQEWNDDKLRFSSYHLLSKRTYFATKSPTAITKEETLTITGPRITVPILKIPFLDVKKLIKQDITEIQVTWRKR